MNSDPSQDRLPDDEREAILTAMALGQFDDSRRDEAAGRLRAPDTEHARRIVEMTRQVADALRAGRDDDLRSLAAAGRSQDLRRTIIATIASATGPAGRPRGPSAAPPVVGRRGRWGMVLLVGSLAAAILVAAGLLLAPPQFLGNLLVPPVMVAQKTSSDQAAEAANRVRDGRRAKTAPHDGLAANDKHFDRAAAEGVGPVTALRTPATRSGDPGATIDVSGGGGGGRGEAKVSGDANVPAARMPPAARAPLGEGNRSAASDTSTGSDTPKASGTPKASDTRKDGATLSRGARAPMRKQVDRLADGEPADASPATELRTREDANAPRTEMAPRALAQRQELAKKRISDGIPLPQPPAAGAPAPSRKDAEAGTAVPLEEHGALSDLTKAKVADRHGAAATHDTDSYGEIRRSLASGRLPPRSAVRIDELVNHFRYDDPPPQGNLPFSVTVEAATSPWHEGRILVLLGLQARDETGGGGRRAFTTIHEVDAGRRPPATSEAQHSDGNAPGRQRLDAAKDLPAIGRAVPIPEKVVGFEAASADLRFAAAVAAFGEILRGGDGEDLDDGGGITLAKVARIAEAAVGRDADGSRAEFVALVRKAVKLLEGQEPETATPR